MNKRQKNNAIMKVSTNSEALSNIGGGEDKLDCFLLA